MTKLALLVVFLGLGALSAVGCDGGGGLEATPSNPASASSASFWPTTAMDASGATVDVWWKHRMNGGKAMPVTISGNAGTAKLGDRLTKITGAGTQQSTTFDLTLTLSDGTTSVTNQASSTEQDTLAPGPPSGAVSQHFHQVQHVSATGVVLNQTVDSMATLSVPWINFGDRTDLDQLPVGHVDEGMAMIEVTATATASSGAQTNTQTLSATTNDHQVWTIQEQLPSMTVLGKTYARVVKVGVRRDSTDQATLMTTTAMSTLWLAAGIGVIKSEQAAVGTTPFPITAELIDTNLGAM